MNKYLVEVQENFEGNCYIELPEELMEKLNWNEQTNVEWSIMDDESIVLKRVDSQPLVFTPLSKYQEQCEGCTNPTGTRCESNVSDCPFRETQ